MKAKHIATAPFIGDTGKRSGTIYLYTQQEIDDHIVKYGSKWLRYRETISKRLRGE